jgi:hypothetical protein
MAPYFLRTCFVRFINSDPLNPLVLVLNIFEQIDLSLILTFFQIWDLILIFELGKWFWLQFFLKSS